jgi:hypothetical protein
MDPWHGNDGKVEWVHCNKLFLGNFNILKKHAG